MVDAIEINMISIRLELTILSMRRGASFCHVSIMNRILQDICLAILGTQKCKGAPPNFNTRDKIIRRLNILLVNIEYQERVLLYMSTEVIISRLDLILWIMKYFMEASASSVLPLIFMRGRKPIKLISRPIHIVNQWEDERENRVPAIMIEINKKLEGKNLLFIKGRTISSCSK